MKNKQNEITSEIKANILSEALPYIRHFYDNIIVIKYGGNAMTNNELKEQFAKDVALLHLVGMFPVIIHGGGPQINNILDKVGKKHEFIQGLRVTDQETMSIVEMVLGGSINNEIVSLLNLHGGRAIGLNGNDAHFLKVEKLKFNDAEQKSIDLGYVGKIVDIDVSIINSILEKGYIPVIAPIGVDEYGKSYNINADSVAGEIAQAIKAQKLIILTNTPGVLDKDGNLLTKLTPTKVASLKKDGTLKGGMLPKIDSAIETVQNGVDAVHIIDGRVPHALLLEIFTDKGVGSMILK